jgi:hypothetical protein
MSLQWALSKGYCNLQESEPIRQFVIYKKDFGWMDVWELNPERLNRFG